jgi:hypothetical protein
MEIAPISVGLVGSWRAKVLANGVRLLQDARVLALLQAGTQLALVHYLAGTYD